jgi:hypothetical protein
VAWGHQFKFKRVQRAQPQWNRGKEHRPMSEDVVPNAPWVPRRRPPTTRLCPAHNGGCGGLWGSNTIDASCISTLL